MQEGSPTYLFNECVKNDSKILHSVTDGQGNKMKCGV